MRWLEVLVHSAAVPEYRLRVESKEQEAMEIEEAKEVKDGSDPCKYRQGKRLGHTKAWAFVVSFRSREALIRATFPRWKKYIFVSARLVCSVSPAFSTRPSAVAPRSFSLDIINAGLVHYSS